MSYSPLRFLLGVLGVVNIQPSPSTVPAVPAVLPPAAFAPDSTHFPVQCTPVSSDPPPPPPLHSTAPTHLEIIGAGLSKTGTQSIKYAFEALGYTVYNVESMMYHRHLDMVMAIYTSTDIHERRQRVEAFRAKILETRATVVLDVPCNVLYKDLHALDPEAQVLLSVRDSPAKWTQSIQKTFHAFAPVLTWPYSWFFDMETYAKLMWFPECEHGVDVWEPWFFPWVKIAHRYFMVDEARCRQMYTDYIQDAKDNIPAHKLWVYNVADHWPTILDMLNISRDGIELPEFPNVNRQSDMDTISFFTRFIAYAYPAIGIIMLATVICTLYGLFRCCCVVIAAKCCCCTHHGRFSRWWYYCLFWYPAASPAYPILPRCPSPSPSPSPSDL